ncbi:MAG: YcaO-like family protein [Chloroflexi bacterium]|nr:YcaO-like family protein [Chloroflexota bacterium]
MGITRIANVTGLDSIGVPVVMVCRPNSRSLAVSQGKGLDLAAAKASGVMESVEMYHAERIDLPLRSGSMDEVERIGRVADALQLARPADRPFDRDRRVLWVEGRDLLHDESTWVPYDMVHTDFTVDSVREPGRRSFTPSSNGLASGNHLLEAISHGICEVVERDAAALWELPDAGMRAETRVDPATVDDPGCRRVLDRFERARIDVGVWEMTSDVGIPCFRCLIADREIDPFRPLYAAEGQGCHPARDVALVRALTEAAQSRLTVIAGSRDDTFRDEYDRTTKEDVLARNRELLRPGGPMKSFAGPSRDNETFEEDVDWELACLRAAGIEQVVMVDLTRPELCIPVVRIVIPGLEFRPEGKNHGYGHRARRVLGERIQRAVTARRVASRPSP